nr:minor capsid protein [Tenacibaculum mesophilum]
MDEVFDAVDFDSPDYVLREKLKQNVWRFSAAKNYNDLTRLNNSLLHEDGSLRNWNEFKREAQKVVGDSTRYLKTEYNTIVASAQMARLWDEIQRDKHIFPYVQFIVVKDNHTSEICSPLHNVIVSVDDPMLLVYFPPNHFNCRTTIKKLRRGVPTKDWIRPDIPEAFKNNPAITGKVFSEDNSYIENTPNDVLLTAGTLYANNLKEAFKDASPEFRKQLELYKLKYPLYQKTDNSLVEVSLWHDATEPRNLVVAKHIANKFNANIKLRPHTDGKYLNEPNPEYVFDGLIADRKSPVGLNLKNLLRKAHNKQNCEVLILDLENNNNSIDVMLNEISKKLKNPTNYPKIKRVILISKDMTDFREFRR